MSKRFIITLATLLVIIFGAGIAIFLAKGYTFSPKEGRMVGTGIISVVSIPDGASVYIDGHLTTATNTNISSLSPQHYQLKIVKEGYIPWEKKIKVFEGLVTEVKATLFPALPTIYPLTFNGVINPTLSPDGQKLAFAVPFSFDGHTRQKGGVWVWTMGSQPISFARAAEPHQIVISSSSLDFSQGTISWSPNSKELLLTSQEGGLEGEANQRNYLLPFDQLTSASSLRDITPLLASTLKGWKEDQKTKDEAKLIIITDLKFRKIASESANLKWSPDEIKFVTDERPTTKVYDLKDKKEYNLPDAKAYFWLPDSLHLVLAGEGKISLVEFDGSNEAVIFAGKFENSFIFPWPDSSRLVILTSYPTPTGSKPNLFGINLK